MARLNYSMSYTVKQTAKFVLHSAPMKYHEQNSAWGYGKAWIRKMDFRSEKIKGEMN